MIYPKLINSSLLDVKIMDPNSIPHCYNDVTLHEPPPESVWGPGAIILVSNSRKSMNYNA